MQTEAMLKFVNSMMLDMTGFRNDNLKMETASLNSFPFYEAKDLLAMEHPNPK
jgi:hypothetical protein